MAYFPQPHPSQRARRHRMWESVPILFTHGQGLQIGGRLYYVSDTGGSAEMDFLLPASTLVHLTLRTSRGPVAAVAEMLPALSAQRQPFRFIALDEADRENLKRLFSC